MDNLPPQYTCEHCRKPFSKKKALYGHKKIHSNRPRQPRRVREPMMPVVLVAQESAPMAVEMVAQESAPRAAVMVAQENARPAAVMVEAQGNFRVPDLNLPAEPEDNQV